MQDYNHVMQGHSGVQKGQGQLPQQQSLSRLSQLLWNRRHRILQALEPHLSQLSRNLLRKDYRKVLPKILQARNQFKPRFKALQKSSANLGARQWSDTWEQFRLCLQEKLHEIISGLLNELADRLAIRLKGIGEGNLLAKGIGLYSSVTGSYRQRLTLLQRLAPTIRTLSYIENQMVQRSGDRDFSSSIWVLLYIFSFAFVQMFGKYITRVEKQQVIRIIKFTFVRNLAAIVSGLETSNGLSPSESMVDGWIDEIGRVVLASNTSL